jgi:hypothetical protein
MRRAQQMRDVVKAWNASSDSASGAIRSTVRPSQMAVVTPSIGSFFQVVWSGPSGNIGE